MNKVYKLVWSKVRHCYVVVSELAKSHGKDKSMRSSIRRGAFLMFLGMLPMEMVSAAIPMANQPIVNGVGAGPNSVAITLGDNTTGVFEVTANGHSFAVGSGAVASGALAVAMGDGTKAGDYSFATGVRTEASGFVSTAMGQETKATGFYSTALGYRSQATNESAFAAGSYSKATGQWAVALGQGAEANSGASVAVGFHTLAGYHGFAGGSYSKSLGMGSVALGGGETEHDAFFFFSCGKRSRCKVTKLCSTGRWINCFQGKRENRLR